MNSNSEKLLEKLNVAKTKSKMKPPSLPFRLQLVVVNFIAAYLIFVLQLLNLLKIVLSPFYRLFFATRHPVIVRTPEDRFVAANLESLGYPFQSNYLEIPLGSGRGQERPRLHYIDECNGDKQAAIETILCLHGEPSWSFLYRTMIPDLVSAGYRVVVPDMIGFGKSDKYVDMDNYNHEVHTFTIKHLIDDLGLGNNITLVCQDWGGLTGLSVVKDMPDRFSNLVIMNTGLPTGVEDQQLIQAPLKTIRSWLPFLLWRSFVQLCGNNLPVHFIFKRLVGLNSAVAKAYAAPFPDSTYKAGAAKWPLMVPLFRDDSVTQHMVEARSCLKVWQKPALIMFGDSDPITAGMDQVFKQLMPDAKCVSVEGASHFLQETHGPELSANILRFLNKKL